MLFDKIKKQIKNRLPNKETKIEGKQKYYKINDKKFTKKYFCSSFEIKIFIIFFSLLIILSFFLTFLLRFRNFNNKKSNRLPRKEALKRGRKYLDKCLAGLLFNHKEFQISKEPKISVIVPVYNAEKLIKSVVRSIQNQNMTDIEICLL